PGTRSAQTDNTYGTSTRAFNINPYSYATGTSRMLTAYDENGNLEYFKQNYAPFNILNELENNYAKLGVVDYKIQGTASYDVIPSLNLSVVGAYRYQKSETQTSVTENANMVKAYRAMNDLTTIGNNPLLYQDPNNILQYPQTVLPEGGFYFSQSNTMKQYYLRGSMNYNQTFAQDHIITIFGSMELRSTDRVNQSFDGVGYQYDNGGLSTPYYLYFKQLAESGGSYFSMQPTKERYLAYLGQLTYSYKNKYNVTGSYRYDGSNTMGKSRTARWLPTWNVAGSWNIDEEAFWKKNDVITSATLRASYGLVANTGSATNTAATFYSAISDRRVLTDRETVIDLRNLENSELTWEKQHELDLGANLGFFNNRITLMMDYYSRQQFDLIGSIPNAGIGGQSVKIGNYADMKGKGFEFTLEAKVITKKTWGWTTRFNIARNTNKITNLQVNPRVVNAITGNGAAVLGGPVRSLYSVPFATLDHNYGFPTFYGPDSPLPTAYINQQLQDLSFLRYEGPIDPVTTGGWYNNFTYKGFSLSGLIKFSSGNAVRLSPNIANQYSDMTAMTKSALDRWIMPGDETRTTVPSLLDALIGNQRVTNLNGVNISSGYPYNTYNNSTERTVSGDYIKLAFANLSYAIPSDVCKKMGIRSSSLGVTTNNILTIKADRRLGGQDPEFFNSGGVAIPQARYFTFTLKLGF
ncbi:MAG: SusC/RagA family protein, partial [Pseudopedobacter saltans]